MRTIEQIQQAQKPVSNDIKVGDYVFATKYSDADPNDRWIISFVKEALPNEGDDLYVRFIETGLMRFKYAQKITLSEGKYILASWAKYR